MPRIVFLDGVRGVAALFVLGYHLHTVFGGFDWFALGYLSVDIFFVLSGYVMTRTYEPRFASGMTPGQFLVARYWRLWPTMAVGTSIGLALALATGIPWASALAMFAATVAFVPHAGPEPFALNRPVWSIFFEVFANLAHVLLFWRLGQRVLMVIACAAVIAMVPFWIGGNFNLGNKANDFLGGFPRVMVGYIIGVVLSRMDLKIPSVPNTLAPLATWLGALSFPLYAVHYPVLQIARHTLIGPYIGAALSVVIAMAIVWLGQTAKAFVRGSSRSRPLPLP